jgi:hypothetical protein
MFHWMALERKKEKEGLIMVFNKAKASNLKNL